MLWYNECIDHLHTCYCLKVNAVLLHYPEAPGAGHDSSSVFGLGGGVTHEIALCVSLNISFVCLHLFHPVQLSLRSLQQQTAEPHTQRMIADGSNSNISTLGIRESHSDKLLSVAPFSPCINIHLGRSEWPAYSTGEDTFQWSDT